MYTAKLSNTCIKGFSLPSNLIYELNVIIRLFVFYRNFQFAGVYLSDTVPLKTYGYSAAVYRALQVYKAFRFAFFFPYCLRERTADAAKNTVGNAKSAVCIH